VRNLFAYILKQYFFFLFLLLEVIAFYFVLQNNHQRATFLNSTGKITGSVLLTLNNVSEYLTLKKANEKLVEENARLRNQLQESFLTTDKEEHYSRDSIYRYIGARVISNSVNHQKNYLMLNKGSRHGITKDMGVITSDGIVGTVVDVTPQFSRVMSVLHVSNKINGRILKNNHLGTVEWTGNYYRYGTLVDIPMHVQLYSGDTIVTSGNSLIFPEGIMVGTVEEYNILPNEKFNTASISYAVDYNSLYYVYVIINMKKREQLWLEKNQQNDQ
jgi:rod shape-determining protein MreC